MQRRTGASGRKGPREMLTALGLQNSLRWFHKHFQPPDDCTVIKRACPTSSPCHASPGTATIQVVQPTEPVNWSGQNQPYKRTQIIFGWVCSPIELTTWPPNCRHGPVREGVRGQGWSHLLWWLWSLQLVKLIWKPHVLWGPVTKFVSFGKSLQSLLIRSTACEIMALRVILSGRGAFWRISWEIVFFEIHRGAVPVPPMAIWSTVSLCRKGVSHPMGEI